MLEVKHRLGYLPRFRSGEPHHANTATPGRCRDSDDSVVEVHRVIVAGDATTFSISAFSSSYDSTPGWYIATLPARSSSTSVGVVEAPYMSKLYLLMGTGMSSRPA